MTNYEYYKKELEEIWLAGRNIAADKDGNITPCGSETDCKECIFNSGCNTCATLRKAWYNEKHVVKLKDDLSNLSEYAANNSVVVEISDESGFILGIHRELVLTVRKLLTPYYIEIGVIDRPITAEDITKAVDALYNFFPVK